MTHKTNAMRVLDQRRIPYTAFQYDAALHSGVEVAQAIGAAPEQVFKTLVVLRDRGRPLLAIIPSDHELDLKRMAAAAGEKRVRMATQREAESLTGLLVGGISALALLQKGFAVFLDDSAQRFEEIYVSAGQRGINLRLRVADLAAVTKASIAPLTGR
jgi:Cys-tRNA(Pro)/Cys-tRNA(Cys) deacylase